MCFKTALFSATISLACAGWASAQDVPSPNSVFFEVSPYFRMDGDRGWAPTTVRGYTEDVPAGGNPRVLILPEITLRQDSIQAYDDTGAQFDPLAEPGKTAVVVEVMAEIERDRLSDELLPAIAGAVFNQPQEATYSNVAPGANGQPFRDQNYAWLPTQSRMEVDNRTIAHGRQHAAQNALVANLKNGHDLKPISIEGLMLRLRLDGQTLTERRIDGSVVMSSGQLPRLVVRNPSAYQLRRIADGGAELVVAFQFNDKQTAFIDAVFDLDIFLSSFLSVHQKAKTTRSSSGFKILGFGYRRTSLRQTFDSELLQNTNVDSVERTRIIMSDANTAMLARFENAFFPQVSRSNAIQNHLDAAQKATQEGKLDLAKLHSDYAASLKDGLGFDTVDIGKAAAALALQDYATFLAAGVRAGIESDQNSTTLRKLDRRQTTIDQNRSWFEAQKITVTRQMSYVVNNTPKADMTGDIGFCGVNDLTFVETKGCGFGLVVQNQVQGVLLTCVREGGGLALSGIGAGAILTHVDGDPVQSTGDAIDKVSRLRPGDRIPVRLFEHRPGHMCSKTRLERVKVTAIPKL